MPDNALYGYAPPTQAEPDFGAMSRNQQLRYLDQRFGTLRSRTGGDRHFNTPANMARYGITQEEVDLRARLKDSGIQDIGETLGGVGAAAGVLYGGATLLGGLAGGTGSGLGAFSNGGAAGIGGLGGGNAGALAASGGIAGGAGIGGTTAGALGGLSGIANSVSGVGGGSMPWDWGRILDYAAPVVGGLLERDGARDAARTSAAGSDAAIAEQRRQYDTSRADQMPWLDAGRAALGRLNDPNAFTSSPGYAFQREEGTRDIGNSFAARGGALSGNALRRLTEFNSGLAAQDYGNWYNREASQAGLGQTTASGLGQLGAYSANNIGNALQDGANARASGVAGQTNALTGTLSDLLSTWNRNRKPNYGGNGGGWS